MASDSFEQKYTVQPEYVDDFIDALCGSCSKNKCSCFDKRQEQHDTYKLLKAAAVHGKPEGSVTEFEVKVTLYRDDIPDTFEDIISALGSDKNFAAEIIGLYFENACAQAGVRPYEIKDCDSPDFTITLDTENPSNDRIEISRFYNL